MHDYSIYDQEKKTTAICNYNIPWVIKCILISEMLKYEKKYTLESLINSIIDGWGCSKTVISERGPPWLLAFFKK